MKRRFMHKCYFIIFISELILFAIIMTSIAAYAGAGMEASHPYETLNLHIIYGFLSQPIQPVYLDFQGIRMSMPSYENLPSSLIRSYFQMQYESITDLYSRSSYTSFYMPHYASYPYYMPYIPWSLLQNER
ncbi:MAG: hypothetical protein ACMUIU_06555 [bacterium]